MDRNKLYITQTPQGFRFKDIYNLNWNVIRTKSDFYKINKERHNSATHSSWSKLTNNKTKLSQK